MVESTKTRIRTAILLLGDVLPDVLTAEVGLAPTSTWRKGDPIGKKGVQHHRQDGWEVVSEYVHTLDTEEVVRLLLGRIEPHIDRIRVACQRHNLYSELAIYITWSDDESLPSLHFEKELLASVVRLGATIDIDLIAVSDKRGA